jgi:hypothetical protein
MEWDPFVLGEEKGVSDGPSEFAVLRREVDERRLPRYKINWKRMSLL